uniref:NADH-ubiquinone oxidoreductase chain 6 n=1 Tax=Paratrichocladius tamaater TaxID=2050714 RepID=A0A8K1K673_9DIPT|nr:NADH dehydrogenase subunit 6 [Paratrichocladius tamaater]UDD74599.1 NADH dehydrogenase subunit 6 [Paratrichocladius tamaater]
MFNLFLSLLSLTCSTIFTFMKHPLAMGLMLLMQTFLICIISGLISKTFWFSYILFLIFLGGMLVLFIYVTSLASNEMFNFSMKILSMSLLTFTTLFMTLIFIDKNMVMTYFMNHENESLTLMENFIMENSLTLNKLYNFPVNLTTILLMIYLFLTLIAVVKITNIFEGPLRPNF